MDDLQREMNQFFDKLWHAGVRTGPLDGQDWSPSLDVVEEPDAVVVRAEVPGCSVHDIEVTLADGELTLRGEKHADDDGGSSVRRVRCERRFGKFSRTIDVPCAVRESEITASVRNGVLRVVLPKEESSRAKSVRINVADDEAGPGKP
jgi:HSP20 family protein